MRTVFLDYVHYSRPAIGRPEAKVPGLPRTASQRRATARRVLAFADRKAYTRQQVWPPNAVLPLTDFDRESRLRARQLANGCEVSFLGGVDAYATEWARSADLSEPVDNDDPVSRWKAQLTRELARMHRIE